MDFVARFILGGGATGPQTSVRFTVRGGEALEQPGPFGGRELRRRERRAPLSFRACREQVGEVMARGIRRETEADDTLGRVGQD